MVDYSKIKFPVNVAVYGSLLRGEHNHQTMISANGTFVKEGLTNPEYTLVSLGSFPGLIENGDTAVKVEVFSVGTVEGLRRLDGLEGYHSDSKVEDNFYTRKTVVLDDNTEVYIYVLTDESYLSRKKVESGDWKEFLHGTKK